MILRCIAVDDEPFALEIIRDFVARVPFLRLEAACLDPLEAMDNYVRIFTEQKTYTTLMSMKNIVDLLPSNQFVRIHKSFIVSIPKVTSFTRELVTIGKKQIPVGRAFTAGFLEAMKLPG